MKLWAVVPVKPLSQAKSRLMDLLDDQERQEFVLQMVRHTLQILTEWQKIDGVLVISADPDILEAAVGYGVDLLLEPDVPGLNRSLYRANDILRGEDCDGIIVIPIDLPYLNHLYLDQMLPTKFISPMVCIAPDHHLQGTNILLVAPIGAIPYRFGRGSFHKHIQSAQKRGIPTQIVNLPELAFDVDLPADYPKAVQLLNAKGLLS
jgi:2-phospho-L-lactate/phosphoenolpyruvate guanylyltransferase